MKRGGIFTGLGDLGGQTLALRTINSAGQTTANPFAAAVQTVLRQQQGADNLTVDGKWGDCSQQAYINAFGHKPNPDDLYYIMEVYHFGEPTLKAWDKTPHCPSPEGEVTGAFNDKIQPALVLAKMLGLPAPAGVCDEGMSPNLETGACEKKVSSTMVYSLRASSSLPAFRSMSTTAVQSKLTQMRPVSVLASLIKTITPGSTSAQTSAATPGSTQSVSQPGSTPFAPAAAGMSGGAKLAVAALAIAAIGGVFWWQRSKSAVPNCGFYPNCGE